jgi:glycosyltransferase involved in cell wall biosynthesis
MHLYFWQNIISPHQADFIRAIAERGHDVIVAAAEAMSPKRGELGWRTPDVAPASVMLNPSPADVMRLTRDSPSETIHCIAGARVISLGSHVVRACRKYGRRMGIISETPDPRGLRGFGRWIEYAIEARRECKNFDFVFAMGDMGEQWFRSVGYAEEKVFPCAYVSTFDVPLRRDTATGGQTRLLFAGQLITRKGVDLLLRAIARVPGVHLDVVGSGPERERLTNLAETLVIADRVLWLGSMDRQSIAARVLEADVLVLPSRFDGWGAVVNEALSLGTPVICSSAAGASDLIRHEWLGSVARTEDVSAFASAIAVWAQRGRRTESERERIREWALCIGGPAIAEYMVRVFEHVYSERAAPVPPWRVTGMPTH